MKIQSPFTEEMYLLITKESFSSMSARKKTTQRFSEISQLIFCSKVVLTLESKVS
jgi:hypothetical protein